mmetsp:Transcript_19228/g.31475  ORF Transcript_19228/g.31475 Transcript_19228/m.31475 type:complete len:116 (+) Transcript_19228:120-467(+)
MFVWVKFGEDQQKIVNTNCSCVVLNDYLRKLCNCAQYPKVDLADEKGGRRNLQDHADEYAKDFLVERASYSLLGITESGEVVKLYSQKDAAGTKKATGSEPRAGGVKIASQAPKR